MRVADLMDAMGAIAPLHYAQSWDNVGLLVGSAQRELTGPTLLTIDMTESVLNEAIRGKCSAIISYHPPIWDPIKRLTDGPLSQRLILHAIEAGIAVYSPHTALDAARGGMTEWLCEAFSGEGGTGGDCRALEAHITRDPQQEVKIVTFLPHEDLEKVRNALATTGAGRIGHYEVCSFSTPGKGSFLGGDGADPFIGEVGQLQTVQEVRLEMVCSESSLPLALDTLEHFHPYEEPAIDVYTLHGRPKRRSGAGRRIVLDQATDLTSLAKRLKMHLGTSWVKLASAQEDKTISHIGVCPGAGASLVDAAIEDKCELFVTGEMRHHEVLDAVNRGLSIMLAGHTNTERGYLPRLADRLSEMLPDGKFIVSQSDKTPFTYL